MILCSACNVHLVHMHIRQQQNHRSLLLNNSLPPSIQVQFFGGKKSLTVQTLISVGSWCSFYVPWHAQLNPFRRLAGLSCPLVFCRYINEDRITIYVEHPVPLDPPVAETPAPPMPLMLTAKEKKKIRKQRREEREKERQVCSRSWDGPDRCLLVGCSKMTLYYMHIPCLFVCQGCQPCAVQ